MEGQAYKRKAFYSGDQLFGRYLYGCVCDHPETIDPSDTTSSYRKFRCKRGELPVSALSGDRYFAGGFVCEVHCTRRYQSWGDEDPVCHFAAQEPHQAS